MIRYVAFGAYYDGGMYPRFRSDRYTWVWLFAKPVLRDLRRCAVWMAERRGR